eukprot:CAMPEP_0171445366 /NCGR_PEP_ID=MMETSP0881-20121228/35779_1 /TAXON_ID=67004 /ORGANISM="Thalassiosira weissflogii, Strain CCMP1336" /LENGTH=74 /DNA_ID=CAMNT_0011969349 /DNA_START=118 /DNA_END=338 /DNA_ORIENTATION=+
MKYAVPLCSVMLMHECVSSSSIRRGRRLDSKPSKPVPLFDAKAGKSSKADKAGKSINKMPFSKASKEPEQEHEP